MSGRRLTLSRIVRRFLIFVVGTMSMAVLYYVIFALVFSTDTERRLRQQNQIGRAHV